MTENLNSVDTLFVAILAGGSSAEAEVSRNSAAQIQRALSQAGHSAVTIELDQHCAAALIAAQPDVVFPALHGPPGEDGTVQGMLEMLRLPYVGSDVRGCAVAMDKAIAKGVFLRSGLPVTADLIVRPEQNLQEAAIEIGANFGASLAIKPLNQGGPPLACSCCRTAVILVTSLAASLIYGSCLVEPFIRGREMTVGVLQLGDELLVHPVIEILTPEDTWYDYEHRYTEGQSQHVMPAQITRSLTERLQGIALDAHRSLGLRDLSRADFIVTEKSEIYLF